MRKLQFPRRSLTQIALPGHHVQQDVSPSTATNSAAAAAADLGPLPGQVEFQNLFWNKTFVSMEGVSEPEPDQVWIRPSPLESPKPLRIPKPPPPPPPPQSVYRPRPHPHAVVNGNSAGHEITGASGQSTSLSAPSSRIMISRNHMDDTAPPPPPTPTITLPAQIEFQDAFWGSIQVPTAKINEEFINTSSHSNVSRLSLCRGPA